MVPQGENIASNPTPEGDDVVFINGKSPDRWVRIAYGILDCAAILTPDRSITFGDVRDGTSRTILVAEVRYGVPWTMPGGDLKFDQMTFRINGSPASIGTIQLLVASRNRRFAALPDGYLNIVLQGVWAVDLEQQAVGQFVAPCLDRLADTMIARISM